MLRQVALMVLAAVLLVAALVAADYINDERAERKRCAEASSGGDWNWGAREGC